MADPTSQIVRLNLALSERYRIERELGQGGMATVYLAEDLKHKRKVAVKVLKPELAAVLGAERFVQEITTTAALQHPHVLPLFDSGTADGFLYYVMPFIDGETLRTRLDHETQLGIDEPVQITSNVENLTSRVCGRNSCAEWVLRVGAGRIGPRTDTGPNMGEIMVETKLARSYARWPTASNGSNRMLMNMSCLQRALLLVAAVSFMGACESPEQRPGESALADTSGIRASIDSLAANVTRAEQTGNAELFASTWARDGIMSLPGSPPVHGRDSIVAAFRRQPPLPPGGKMTIHPTELQILNREWAYVMGVDTLSYTPQGSAAPVKETSTFLVVLRKTAEGWQTYREVLSPNQTRD